MKTARILLALAVMAFFYQQGHGYICVVPDSSSTIQSCINAVSDGDTVLVNPGHYHENIDFLGKSILVASQFIFNSNITTIDSTIIYGDSPTHPDTASVIRFISSEDTNSVICGFTIRDGTGTKVQTPGYYLERGGGIVCLNASPKILNNVIANNFAYNGGGIFCWGGAPIINDNVITFNEAPQYSSDIGDAGGIYITHTNGIVIEGNVIDTNSAYKYGGGILVTFGSENTTIVNNTIARNSASPGEGAGIDIYSGSGTEIKNNIIFCNHTIGIRCRTSTVSVIYNNVFSNPGGDFVGCPPGVGNTTWGENFNETPCDSFYNIIVDPLFDPDSTNYALLCSSECIDAGDEDFPPLVVGGAKIDQGAWEYPYILGDANGDSIVNGGDITALINCIFGGQPSECPCPWRAGDANCDGSVGAGDIVFLLSYLYRGGPPPDCEDCKTEMVSHKTTYNRFGQVAFASPVRLDDNLVELSLLGDVEIEVWGVDLQISYDPKTIEIVNPELGNMAKNFQVFHGYQDGLFRVGLFDVSGQHHISPGKGTLLTLKVKGTDLSSLRISKALLFNEHGNAFVAGTDKVKESISLPDHFALHQNYPNPFNPVTQISYDLPVAGHVKLAVYNIRGQKVKILVNKYQAAGHKTVIWNSRDEAGDKVASGIYFYRLEAGNFTETKKMLLLQ